MRIMGLDYGSVTVRVAISDPLLLTARELKLYEENRKISLERL